MTPPATAIRLRAASCGALLLLAALHTRAAETGTYGPEIPDPHSGESTLQRMLGTRDLSALRKRALEIGPREKAKELARARRAQAAGTQSEPSWSEIGPRGFRPRDAGADKVGSGLVANLALHPTDPRTIWVATSGGGVWKTTDGGTSWRGLMDDQAILPTGAVAVSRSQPQRVVVGDRGRRHAAIAQRHLRREERAGRPARRDHDRHETRRRSAAGAGRGRTRWGPASNAS